MARAGQRSRRFDEPPQQVIELELGVQRDACADECARPGSLKDAGFRHTSSIDGNAAATRGTLRETA